MQSETGSPKSYRNTRDRRSIRSAQMIYQGLVKLMREKRFESISVTDLVTRAKVGRTTFYRHFNVVEDVLRMHCEEVVQGLTEYLQAYQRDRQGESVTRVLKPVLRYFYLHSEVIELLMRARRIHILEDSLYRHFLQYQVVFRTYFRVAEDYLPYIMLARIGSLTKILEHWIATGKQQAPDALADNLGGILSDIVALDHWL